MFLGSIVLCCLVSIVNSTPKKGYGLNYGKNFLCDDTTTLTDATWWYDWKNHHDEFTKNRCTHEPKGEYVPMIWGWSQGVNLNIPSAAKFVLGFNEPNQKDQSNLSPQDAAHHWREIENHAHGKLLVSPAPSGCHGGPNCNMGPTQWLDAFFQACHNCRVDYIGAHAYSCNADHDMRYLENMYHRYKKKVWLTEFACPHTSSETDMLNYMKAILPRLENADFVYRYAWFITRWKNDGFLTTAVDLLSKGSTALMPLGHFYNNFHHTK